MVEPMLCKDDLLRFHSKFHRLPIYYSPKLDGVRCLAHVKPGGVDYWSRSGKRFNNFSRFNIFLQTMRREMDQDEVWFDGEVTAEGFSKVMTQLRRLKDVDPSMFRFDLFDVICDEPFSVRWEYLKNAYSVLAPFNGRPITLVPHYLITAEWTPEFLEDLMERSVYDGQEGIVCKVSSSTYTESKSDLWLKVKPWKTVDMVVTGVVPGKGKHEGRMGALMCEGEGYKAKVGTGFDDDERAEFMVNPPRMIEVKYQEATKDNSLRFPSFVRVREDK